MKNFVAIIIILLACLSGFSQINQYGSLSRGITNVSGTTLPDMKGSADGTLNGTVLPTVINGYLRFNNSSGTGNLSRVNAAIATYNYTYNSKFTLTLIIRTAETDARAEALIGCMNGTHGTNWMFQIGSDYKINSTITETQNPFNSKQAITSGTYNDGKWHIITMIYNNNIYSLYIDGMLITNTMDQNLTKVFYNATLPDVFCIGARYYTTLGTYANGYNGDIRYFENTNSAISIATMQNKVLEFQMLLD